MVVCDHLYLLVTQQIPVSNILHTTIEISVFNSLYHIIVL